MEERFHVFPMEHGNFPELAEIVQQILKYSATRSYSGPYVTLSNTLAHVASLSPRCVLWQKSVQDPDFQAEHSAYYSRWTSEVSRYCDRIHFFSEAPKSDDPIEVIDQMAEAPASYLGFITLRPISMSPVAATILKPRSNTPVHFVLSKDEFQVNLAGRQFIVNGTPFIQQDNAVGACAQAAVWMALRTLRRKEGRAAFSPSQITSAATRFLVQSRILPNRKGLSIEQISEAVRAAGYNNHSIPVCDPENINDAALDKAKCDLYPYVESGVPVLLALRPSQNSGHAVLLIGHGWTEAPARMIMLGTITSSAFKSPLEIYDAASWVEPFYIHNDNTGPYLPLTENSPQPEHPYALAHTVTAIPFMPADVFIDASEAQSACLQLLAQSLSKPPLSAEQTEKAPEPYDPPSLVTRLYLIDRSEFRASVVQGNMSEEIKKYYRSKWLPKRVWVMELNALDNYHESPKGEAARLGEILLDPASEPEDGAFLSIHLSKDLLPPQAKSGIVIDRDGIKGKIRAFPVTSGGYSPLVRPGS